MIAAQNSYLAEFAVGRVLFLASLDTAVTVLILVVTESEVVVIPLLTLLLTATEDTILLCLPIPSRSFGNLLGRRGVAR